MRNIAILFEYLVEDSFKVFGDGGDVHSWVICMSLEIRAYLAQIYKAVIGKKSRNVRLLQLGFMNIFKFIIGNGDESLMAAEAVIDKLS